MSYFGLKELWGSSHADFIHVHLTDLWVDLHQAGARLQLAGFGFTKYEQEL